jgi:hypothetical protein
VDCHSRVPSGVPLPAAGLSAASGLYTSRWAEVARTLPQGETELSGATAHFPNLKSRYSEPQATRKKGSFEKLHFSLTRGLAQVSHWRKYKSGDLPFAVRSSVNLVRERDPIAGATAARGIRAAPPIQRDGDRCKTHRQSGVWQKAGPVSGEGRKPALRHGPKIV